MSDPQKGVSGSTTEGATQADPINRSALDAARETNWHAKTRRSAGESREDSPKRQFISIFGRRMPLPASRGWRVTLGIALVVGGIFGFLPILGVWMLPLGFLVLSVDFVFVRRWRRRLGVRWARWQRSRKQSATTESA